MRGRLNADLDDFLRPETPGAAMPVATAAAAANGTKNLFIFNPPLLV